MLPDSISIESFLVGCMFLKSVLYFCIRVGTASISSTPSSQGSVKCLYMVRMNFFIFDILNCLRVFRLRILIFLSFPSPLVGLGAYVLNSNYYTLWKGFAWTSTFSGLNDLIAYFKKKISIATFTICKKRQLLSLI